MKTNVNERKSKSNIPRTDLSADQLRAVLHYDPASGIFTWLENRHAVSAGDRAGCRASNGYTVITVNQAPRKGHRLAWLYSHGHWPEGQIDHINGDKSDNRLCNLRVVTNSLNMQNQRAAMVTNLSCGTLGVSRSRYGKFRARIVIEGRKVGLGSFDSADEASEAYLAAKRRMHPACSI